MTLTRDGGDRLLVANSPVRDRPRVTPTGCPCCDRGGGTSRPIEHWGQPWTAACSLHGGSLCDDRPDLAGWLGGRKPLADSQVTASRSSVSKTCCILTILSALDIEAKCSVRERHLAAKPTGFHSGRSQPVRGRNSDGYAGFA
jgi:hypothetical protein